MKMKNIKNGLPTEDGNYLIRCQYPFDEDCYYKIVFFSKEYSKEYEDCGRIIHKNIFWELDYDYGLIIYESIKYWLNVEDIELEE